MHKTCRQERTLAAANLGEHTHTHILICIKHGSGGGSEADTENKGGWTENGGEKRVYGNDPDKEKRARWKRGERKTFLTGCCFWIERYANEKWR